MGRMAARRAKSKNPQIEKEIERKNQEEIKEIEEEYNGKGGFFACYLLCSRCPRHKGHTYIGFTVNPRRRIQQHNGEKSCGAWRTKRGRPWEMILCIYGFPTNVSALQFEWAWQHPIESLAVRKAASNFKSLSGIANKIKLAYTMLNLPSWESLNLTINFFSTKHMKHIGSCPRLPKHMRVNVCVMDELPCYVEGNIVDQDDYDVDDDGVNFKEEHINNEDVSPSSTSDTSANRIEGDTCPTENRTQEFHCSAGSPDINGSPLRCSLDEAAIDCSKSPSSCSAKQLRQSTSPKISSNSEAPVDCALISPEFVQKTRSFYSHDEHSVQWSGDSNLLLYPQDNVVNLDTPASCVVGKCSTRLKVYSDVVDLTDSPIIIQL